MNTQEAKGRAEEIKEAFFNNREGYEVSGDEESIPLVAANIKVSTNSFAEGQLVYIYDGHWGMAERLKIVGKYRMKHRIIDGHCAIKNVYNFRPKIVFNPAIITKLKGAHISSNLFSGFLEPHGNYIFKVAENA